MLFSREKMLFSILMAFMLFTVSALSFAAPKKIVMKVSSNDGTTIKIGDKTYPYYVYTTLSSFKTAVEELSEGRIEVEIYLNGVLGDHRTTMENMKRGLIQGVTPAEGDLATWFPPIQVITTPYAFKSEPVAWEVLDGPFGKQLFNQMRAKTGFRVVAIGANGGFRIFGNTKRPLKTPTDMKGLKIRTMNIPAHMETVKALGGTPTPIAWTEVYTALQTGVVDGSELPTVGTLTQNLHEVLKYITIDRHAFSSTFLLVDEKWFKSLPKDLQNCILTAGRFSTTASRGVAAFTVEEVMQYFQKRGIQVNRLSPEAQKRWAAVVQPKVLPWMRKQVGDKLVNEFLKACDTAEAKVNSGY
jgi:tripartite ATP-independent transporter DctP family solute receptor